MFPQMRVLELLNVSSRNVNSMNYYVSLTLKEASRRVSIWTIKKGTENLKSLTISSCGGKKKWHIYLNSLHNFLHSHITASCLGTITPITTPLSHTLNNMILSWHDRLYAK